jgi:hypothetical protein
MRVRTSEPDVVSRHGVPTLDMHLPFVIVELVNQRYDEVTGFEQGEFEDWDALKAQLWEACQAGCWIYSSDWEGSSFSTMTSADLPDSVACLLEGGDVQPLLDMRDEVARRGGIMRVLGAVDVEGP